MDRQSKRKIMLALVRLYLNYLDFLLDCMVHCKSQSITQDRKLWVESEHYRRPNGQFGKGGWKKTKSSEPIKLVKLEESRNEEKQDKKKKKKKKGKPVKVSAQGANKFEKYGFINANKQKEHEKHLDEFKLTMDKYIARGMELIQMKTGGDIVGHKDKDEILTRYNVFTNEYAKGRPDRGLYTFFKPVDKKAYYDYMKEKDLEYGGSE